MQEKIIIMPDTKKRLEQMGDQIKEARERRNIPIELVAARAGINVEMVMEAEKGSPELSMGAYAVVLHAIQGMDKDLLLIAKDERLKKMYKELGKE